jgi:hypothetical protein
MSTKKISDIEHDLIQAASAGFCDFPTMEDMDLLPIVTDEQIMREYGPKNDPYWE